MEGTDMAQLVLTALEEDDETSRAWLWNIAVQLATETRGVLSPWDQGTPWRRSIAMDARLRSALATIAQSIARHDAAPPPSCARPRTCRPAPRTCRPAPPPRAVESNGVLAHALEPFYRICFLIKQHDNTKFSRLFFGQL